MKRFLIVFLLLFFSVSLFACSSGSTNNDQAHNVTREKIKQYVNVVDLNRDNWSDYLEFKEITVNEFYDTFGNKKSRYVKAYTLVPKPWCYIKSYSVEYEASIKAERYWYEFSPVIDGSNEQMIDSSIFDGLEPYQIEENIEYTSLQYADVNFVKFNSMNANLSGYVLEYYDAEEGQAERNTLISMTVEQIKGKVYVLNVPEEQKEKDEKGEYWKAKFTDDSPSITLKYYSTGELEVVSPNQDYETYKPIDWNGRAADYNQINGIPLIINIVDYNY